MSKIIAFDALLPNPDLVKKIICPPYDVIDSDEARDFAYNNIYSFLHVAKSEIDFPPDTNIYDPKVYEMALQNLKMFQEENYLFRDKPSLYIYRMIMGDHVQTGLVCGVSAEEYKVGLIKKHELTRKEKEDDRTKHAYILKAHSEPVILVHSESFKIANLIKDRTDGEPLYDVTDHEGVRHILWRIGNDEEIIEAFDDLDALYIADGHHRSAAGSHVSELMKKENPNHTGDEKYNFFPAVIFPSDEVKIYEYDWDGDPKKRPEAHITMEDIMEIADKNEIMPPKSTWFAPKLISGLFVYTF